MLYVIALAELFTLYLYMFECYKRNSTKKNGYTLVISSSVVLSRVSVYTFLTRIHLTNANNSMVSSSPQHSSPLTKTNDNHTGRRNRIQLSDSQWNAAKQSFNNELNAAWKISIQFLCWPIFRNEVARPQDERRNPQTNKEPTNPGHNWVISPQRYYASHVCSDYRNASIDSNATETLSKVLNSNQTKEALWSF